MEDATGNSAGIKPKTEILHAEEQERLGTLFARSGIPPQYVTVVFQFIRQYAVWRTSRPEYIEAQRDSMRYRWIRTSSLVKLAGSELDSLVDAGIQEEEMKGTQDEGRKA